MSNNETAINCPNCGAPIISERCDYCGTLHVNIIKLRRGYESVSQLRMNAYCSSMPCSTYVHATYTY